MNAKDWRTSDLIDAYWELEQDESLRLPGGGGDPATQSRWHSYRLGALANAGSFSLPSPAETWWDEG